MGVREALFEQLSILEVSGEEPIGDDTRLFESGLVESLALMRLAQWIETQVGGELDLTSINIMEEWSTPGNIVAFIEARKTTRA